MNASPLALLVPIGVAVGAHAYLAWRLLGPSTPRWGRPAVWVYLALSLTLPIANFVAMRAGTMLVSLAWPAYLLFGVSSSLFFLLLAAELVRVALYVLDRVRNGRRALVDPGRRQFLGGVVNASVVGTTVSLGGVGVANARSPATVVEVEVPVDGLPPDLDDLRIVQLSDVHVGPTIRREDLEAVVRRCNTLEPDLVVITGDLVDGHVEDLLAEVEPLRELRARHGVFFVTGNHEYYWDGPAWCRYVQSLGVHVLCNEHRAIAVGAATLLVAGVTDYRAHEYVEAHRSSPRAALAGAPEHDFSVLLAHQPRSIFEAAEAGVGLQLSGHTHGGQYVPFNMLVHLAQPYVAGLHRHGASWIYVSRGTGYWGPPMRVGAQHEITSVRLRRRG